MAEDPRAAVARSAFRSFVNKVGRPYDAKTVELVGPAPDCWTHAYAVASAIPDRVYVEGLCVVRGTVHAHAWTVDSADVVHEHTEGYEQAGCYVGFEFDLTAAAKLDAYLPDGPRCSLLEGLLINGVQPGQIVRRFQRGSTDAVRGSDRVPRVREQDRGPGGHRGRATTDRGGRAGR